MKTSPLLVALSWTVEHQIKFCRQTTEECAVELGVSNSRACNVRTQLRKIHQVFSDLPKRKPRPRGEYKKKPKTDVKKVKKKPTSHPRSVSISLVKKYKIIGPPKVYNFTDPYVQELYLKGEIVLIRD